MSQFRRLSLSFQIFDAEIEVLYYLLLLNKLLLELLCKGLLKKLPVYEPSSWQIKLPSELLVTTRMKPSVIVVVIVDDHPGSSCRVVVCSR